MSGFAALDASAYVDTAYGAQPVERNGEYFHAAIAVDNSASAVYALCNITAAVAGNPDVTSSEDRAEFVPRTPENFTYDEDGNLLRDGRWDYVFDTADRLRVMTEKPGLLSGMPRQRLSFSYDTLGRRVQKKVQAYDPGTGAWTATDDRKFLYDGFNLVAEQKSAADTVIRSYAWGLDLSGLIHGAGGVGGLLLIKDVGDPQSTKKYVPGYDGNGKPHHPRGRLHRNPRAKYEYGPFGEPLRAEGDYATENPFRFSTKYTDKESGLSFFGFRYYDPNVGRGWKRGHVYLF